MAPPLVAILVGMGVALAGIGHEGRRARAELDAGQEHFDRGEHGLARDAWQRGLGIAEGLPFHAALSADLHRRLRQANQAEAARDFHRLLKHWRDFTGADSDPRGARALDDLRGSPDAGAAPAQVYYERALLRLAQGNRGAALADLHKALEHDPGHKARRLLETVRARP